MPNATSFNAIISEWKLVIEALEAYKIKIDLEVDAIEDEDKQNEMYDDIERLERLIPDFKSQYNNEFK